MVTRISVTRSVKLLFNFVLYKKKNSLNPNVAIHSFYQRLDLITADDITDREDDVGRLPENASKNRFPDIVPRKIPSFTV